MAIKTYIGYVIKVGSKYLGTSTNGENYALRTLKGADIFTNKKFAFDETKWVKARYKGKVKVMAIKVEELEEVNYD